MISVEDYLGRVLELASVLESEEFPIHEGYGRVLAADLFAKYPVPPFSNSAMDGFACRSKDLAAATTKLRIVGDIPAGVTVLPTVNAGEAARIMTGAPLPPGADCVVPVEQSDQQPGDVPLSQFVVVERVAQGRHVRYRGEDVAAGSAVLHAGSVWSPASAAAAASIGYSRVPLRKRPKVAVLATGTELATPGSPLNTGQIPDSNSVLLSGLVDQFGGEVVLVQTVADDTSQFENALETAEAVGANIIVTTGAVSAGAFEVVRQTLSGRVSFEKVAMQPGKPQACGTLQLGERKLAFLGLPGNPVSVFVSAWVFLRPLMAAFTGALAQPFNVRLKATEAWNPPVGRRQYMPVVAQGDGIRRVHKLGSGSHLVASLHLANALAVVPENVERVCVGDGLDVIAVASGVLG